MQEEVALWTLITKAVKTQKSIIWLDDSSLPLFPQGLKVRKEKLKTTTGAFLASQE